MSNRTIRQSLFRIHQTLGRWLLPFFAFNFFLGLLLLFSAELTLISRPDLWVSPPSGAQRASFGATYDGIRADDPGASVYYMSRSPRPWFGDETYGNTSEGRQVIFWTRTDSGALIGKSSNRDSALRGIVRETHANLMMPFRAAHIAVTALAIPLLISVISGLVTYRRFWRGLLRVPSSANTDARQRFGIWHRLFGVWSALFLLMVGVTVLFFLVERLGARIDPPEPAAAAERAERVAQDFTGADLDRLIGLAEGLHPDLQVTTVGFPGSASQPFFVNGYLAEKGRYFGAVAIAVDPSNGAILGDSSTAEMGAFARVYPLILALHYGNWGGFAGLLLYALFSAAGLALLISAARISVEKLRHETAAPISWPRAYLRQLGLARWAYALGALGLALLIARHLS